MALLLTRTDIQSFLTIKDAMEAVEEAFRQLALGTVDMPQRPVIRVPDHHGVVLFMPALIGGMGALGMKVVSVYPDNPKKYDKPTVLGLILLNDPATGEVVAIMDGGFITAMRTGAVSGVATKYLARSDAQVAGVFGAGVQARAQLLALAEARPLVRAVVYDVVPEARQRFAADLSAQLGIPVEPVDDPRAAVEGCDVIATATSARDPIFDGNWVAPGTHINGIGSHAPDMRELDTAIIQKARVIVDLRAAALAEAGDLIIPIQEGAITADHIAGELGEVIAGRIPGRTSPDEITIFKSEGLAIQDVSVATKVYQLARARSIGQEISI
ncbi:MAG: ornithine cyclodeaminase family protein [Chloroflexi bacterium]|nr:ornithine cyclodeaminase family protein [Chloroflexota bacterium]MBU1878864.1 ornithine cyclodeaminase family protein [Chloroflexota bacterium]